MNRKQKIIISVTCIFLVLLILMGLTYAYFMTRINPNPNNTSIGLKTAKLELTYTDGNGVLTPANALVPGDDVKFLDGDKNIQESKTFSVTNNGEDTEYVVFIDNVQVKYATTSGTQTAGTSTTFESNDFRYTLTCTIVSSDTSRNNTSCNGVENGIFPLVNKTIMVGNDILKGDIHNYTLTMQYIETGKNQSKDMNKGFSAKINIEDINRINPYSSNKNSLAYSIINNAITKKNGTELMATPLTKVAEEISTYTSRKSVTNKYYYPSWEEGKYAWAGLSYGPTKESTYITTEPFQITEVKDPVETCESVIGQYISDNYYCKYDGCWSIGKVIGCEVDGTPILEENDNYTGWDEGDYSWDGLTYGSTQENADNGIGPSKIEEGIDPVEACNSVKGQYIADWYYAKYEGGSLIGKVIGCEADGTPVLTDNYIKSNSVLIEKKHEQTLSITIDDYGTSYYFRGNTKDNYVNFAGMCWRIVRIAGDGSIKLILEDQYTTCDDTETVKTSAIYTGNWNIGTGNYGYEEKNVDSDSFNEKIMNYLKPVTSKENSMIKAFYDFQTIKLSDYVDKLKSGDWCLGDKAYTQSNYTFTPLDEYNYLSKMRYDSYVRLRGDNKEGYHPSYKCNGTILTEFEEVEGVSNKEPMYIGAITADEIVYAGGKVKNTNQNYYLINNYQKNNSIYFWALSMDHYDTQFDIPFCIHGNSEVFNYGVQYDDISFRPVISLKSGITVVSGGEGTIDKPYVIE